LEGVGLFIDGQLIASGIGGEIMGGTLKSLRWLIERLRRRGEILKAGQLVIPGSPVELIPVEAGSRVRATITNFGTVEAEFR
jgi:2-keto-4-pentenoate hydratase